MVRETVREMVFRGASVSGAAPFSAGVMKQMQFMFKAVGETIKQTAPVKRGIKLFGAMKGLITTPFGAIFSLLDMLGALDPIITVINALLSVFSGTLMKQLMPVFMKIIGILTSEGMLDLIAQLATLLGVILTPALEIFATVLQALQPAIFYLTEGIKFVTPLIQGIGTFLSDIVGEGIYQFGLAIATMIDFFTAGAARAVDKWNEMMGKTVESTTDASKAVGELSEDIVENNKVVSDARKVATEVVKTPTGETVVITPEEAHTASGGGGGRVTSGVTTQDLLASQQRDAQIDELQNLRTEIKDLGVVNKMLADELRFANLR